MTNQSSQNNDVINLIDFLENLWSRKWIIVLFTLISLLIGNVIISSELSSQKEVYKSKIAISLNTPPPFEFRGEELYNNFRRTFNSETNFNNWLNATLNNQINIKDLNEISSIITFSAYKNPSTITINSNNQDLLRDIYSYSNYINTRLSNEYVSRAAFQVDSIKSLYKDYGIPDSLGFIEISELEGFIFYIQEGSGILNLDSPTQPTLISVKSRFPLYFFGFLGFFLGVIYVFIRE